MHTPCPAQPSCPPASQTLLLPLGLAAGFACRSPHWHTCVDVCPLPCTQRQHTHLPPAQRLTGPVITTMTRTCPPAQRLTGPVITTMTSTCPPAQRLTGPVITTMTRTCPPAESVTELDDPVERCPQLMAHEAHELVLPGDRVFQLRRRHRNRRSKSESAASHEQLIRLMNWSLRVTAFLSCARRQATIENPTEGQRER
jgi:hypothetical protein